MEKLRLSDDASCGLSLDRIVWDNGCIDDGFDGVQALVMISIGIFASLWWSAIDSVRLCGYFVPETFMMAFDYRLLEFFLPFVLFGFIHHAY
jgi:hypothetical protein